MEDCKGQEAVRRVRVMATKAAGDRWVADATVDRFDGRYGSSDRRARIAGWRAMRAARVRPSRADARVYPRAEREASALRELRRVKSGEGAVGRKERGVGALLDDAAGVDDDDAVGVADGREPVRDDERRAARTGCCAAPPG